MNPLDAVGFEFRRALITLDGSMVAEAILPVFLRLAYPLGMELVLIRVVVPTVSPAAIDDTTPAREHTTPVMERKRKEAEEYLRAVAATPSTGFAWSRPCARARLPTRSSPPRRRCRPT